MGWWWHTEFHLESWVFYTYIDKQKSLDCGVCVSVCVCERVCVNVCVHLWESVCVCCVMMVIYDTFVSICGAMTGNVLTESVCCWFHSCCNSFCHAKVWTGWRRRLLLTRATTSQRWRRLPSQAPTTCSRWARFRTPWHPREDRGLRLVARILRLPRDPRWRKPRAWWGRCVWMCVCVRERERA